MSKAKIIKAAVKAVKSVSKKVAKKAPAKKAVKKTPAKKAVKKTPVKKATVAKRQVAGRPVQGPKTAKQTAGSRPVQGPKTAKQAAGNRPVQGPSNYKGDYFKNLRASQEKFMNTAGVGAKPKRSSTGRKLLSKINKKRGKTLRKVKKSVTSAAKKSATPLGSAAVGAYIGNRSAGSNAGNAARQRHTGYSQAEINAMFNRVHGK